jgi:hypothetical protein
VWHSNVVKQTTTQGIIMRYRIREIETECQFCEQVTVDVITEIVGLEQMESCIAAYGAQEKRIRDLPALLTMLVCIGMNLFSEVSLRFVLIRMVKGIRLLADAQVDDLPEKSAISQARYRLGAKPLERLFKQVCRPIATPQTPGAFAFGLRMVAIDGTTEDVADTPANAAYFGRHTADRGAAAFPQAQGVYLCECGTHVIFDAGFWSVHTSEHVGAKRLLRSVEPDMLVMLDRGLYSYDIVSGVQQKEAQVLCRLSSTLKPVVVKRLADGSYLARIFPGDRQRRRQGEQMIVRIIEYTIDDPNRPGHGQVHRLLTTLLDPIRYPALDLVALYHERWEIEITIDEVDTHQRLLDRPFRSLKPVGVIQEWYGLLIAHFIIRFLMHRAACAYQLDPDRLSFIDSLRLITDAISEFQLIHPDHHPRLWQRLLSDLAACVLPPRENRINPRVVKCKMSKFKKKRPEHFHPPPPRPFRDGVVLLFDP